MQRTNQTQYDQLQDFAAAHRGSILAPVILGRWEDILLSSGEAWASFLETAEFGASAGNYKPMPAVLENILPPELMARAQPDALDVLRRGEEALRAEGFLPEHFEFHECGREAITFKIKHVNDLLLKISIDTEVSRDVHPVLAASGRILIEPNLEGSKTRPISFALVPYLGGAFSAGEKDPFLSNIPLPYRLITPLGAAPRDWTRSIERILNSLGWTFEDRKTTNMRTHTYFPDAPFVIDKRAVAELPEKDPRRNVELNSAEKCLLTVYWELQTGIFMQMALKYQSISHQAMADEFRASGGKYWPQHKGLLYGVAKTARGEGWTPRQLFNIDDTNCMRVYGMPYARRVLRPKLRAVLKIAGGPL